MFGLSAIVRTNHVWIVIKGVIPPSLLHLLRLEYGTHVREHSEFGEQMRNVLDAPLYEKEPLEMSPGDYIRLFRKEAMLSQSELGRKIGGVSRQNICRMERGRRPISRKMALRLSDFFDVSPAKFIAP
jgi:DNA-binding XRE family transcriptional regulator